MLRRFLLLIFSGAMLFILWGQPQEKNIHDTSLPPKMNARLDSLKRSGNLGEWLYVYREYVSEDPVDRISILTRALSNTWRGCRTDTERIEFFNCLATQGYYLMYCGNILASIDAYEKAYHFYFDKPVAGEDVVAFVLKPLGNNYTRLGDYERALFINEKALSLSAGNNDSASVYNNIAIAHRSKGELDTARHAAETGLQVVTKNTSLHGLLLTTLADIFFRQENVEEAGSKISLALNILIAHMKDEGGDSPYWLLSAYRVQGDVFAKKNEPAAALRSYQKALGIIETNYNGERKREKAQVLISMADVEMSIDQPRSAIEKYNKALELLLPSFRSEQEDLPAINELYGEYTLLDALRGKADCLSAMNKKKEALDHYFLFFIAQKKLRHEFFSRVSKQLQQNDYRKVMESAIENAYDLWKINKTSEYADKILLIAEMSKAQMLLDEMISSLEYSRLKNKDTLLEKQQQIMQAINLYEREAAVNSVPGREMVSEQAKKELEYELTFIQKKVKEKYPVTAGYITGDIHSAKDILQRIPAGLTVTEFFTGDSGIYILEISGGAVKNIQRLNNATEIKLGVTNFMTRWFQSGPQNMINDPAGYFNEASRIYNWLCKGMVTSHKNCLIIPDGFLGFLPFDALVTSPDYRPDVSDWPFLVKSANLYYAYSLQTWHQQQQQAGINKKFEGFFISFDSTSASLPAVKKEYEAIQNTIDGDLVCDHEATLKKFNDHLNEVNLLHISTHSFFQGKDNIPVLQLADDKFFLFDLYGRSFHPQLVVLSACRTGHGILAEGEGVISLARGFVAAGSGGIVAGLWNMNDESTAILMGNFYSHLIKIKSPAEALHATKLKWLESVGDKIQKLPYFWAGLTYTGGNVPVIIEKKNQVGWWWWVVAGLFVLLFFIVRRIRGNGQ
jgi:CHAT domain-containing protein